MAPANRKSAERRQEARQFWRVRKSLNLPPLPTTPSRRLPPLRSGWAPQTPKPGDSGHLTRKDRGLKTTLGPNLNSGCSSPSPRPRSLVSPPGADPGRTHLPKRGRRASLTSAAPNANRRRQGRSLLKKKKKIETKQEQRLKGSKHTLLLYSF